jgi:hypothetical protein
MQAWLCFDRWADGEDESAARLIESKDLLGFGDPEVDGSQLVTLRTEMRGHLKKLGLADGPVEVTGERGTVNDG